MRLVADIDAQHVVEPLAHGPKLRHPRECGHDQAEHLQTLSPEPSGDRVANEMPLSAPMVNRTGTVK